MACQNPYMTGYAINQGQLVTAHLTADGWKEYTDSPFVHVTRIPLQDQLTSALDDLERTLENGATGAFLMLDSEKK